jgi:transcriptional regulator with XRE-family HTH domain
LTGHDLERIMSLAMRVRRLRAAKGLTQEALARRAKVSLGYIARLETGHHDPKLSTLRKLARALGVPAAALLD